VGGVCVGVCVWGGGGIPGMGSKQLFDALIRIPGFGKDVERKEGQCSFLGQIRLICSSFCKVNPPPLPTRQVEKETQGEENSIECT